jgi:hypothetical protein
MRGDSVATFGDVESVGTSTGKWRDLFSGTPRFFLPACGPENGARPPNHPLPSPSVLKYDTAASISPSNLHKFSAQVLRIASPSRDP